MRILAFYGRSAVSLLCQAFLFRHLFLSLKDFKANGFCCFDSHSTWVDMIVIWSQFGGLYFTCIIIYWYCCLTVYWIRNWSEGSSDTCYALCNIRDISWTKSAFITEVTSEHVVYIQPFSLVASFSVILC